MAVSMLFGAGHVLKGNTGSIYKPWGANSEEALATYDYINEHLNQDDVVLFFKPRVLCLYTEVRSFVNDPDVTGVIEKADYILDFLEDGSFRNYIQTHQDTLELLLKTNRLRLYKLKKSVESHPVAGSADLLRQ